MTCAYSVRKRLSEFLTSSEGREKLKLRQRCCAVLCVLAAQDSCSQCFLLTQFALWGWGQNYLECAVAINPSNIISPTGGLSFPGVFTKKSHLKYGEQSSLKIGLKKLIALMDTVRLESHNIFGFTIRRIYNNTNNIILLQPQQVKKCVC